MHHVHKNNSRSSAVPRRNFRRASSRGGSIDLGGFAATDPRDALDALEAVSGALETVGREEVRGVETTHYRTTLDPTKLADAVRRAGGSSSLLSGLTEAMAQVDVADLPIDVWSGKVQYVLELPGTADQLWERLGAKLRSQVKRPGTTAISVLRSSSPTSMETGESAGEERPDVAPFECYSSFNKSGADKMVKTVSHERKVTVMLPLFPAG